MSRKRMSRKRIAACAISAGLAVAGLAVAGLAVAGTGTSAGAAVRPSVTTLAGSVAPFTRTTQATGQVPAAEQLTIQLWLQPSTAAATLFAQAVSTPGSPQFHHYLSPDAYAAHFGATPADASAVESWLRAEGFTAISPAPERSYLQATGTAATINRAFHVQLTQYKSSATVNAGGYPLRSNDRPISLPSSLASLVLGVTGLDNAAPTAAKASTAPCSTHYGQYLQTGLPKYLGRTSFPTENCGYSAKQLRDAYGVNLTNTGKGETIALTELAPPDPADFAILTDYAKVMRLPAPSKKRFAEVSVGKGCTDTTDTTDTQQTSSAGQPAQIEEQMDVEAAYAMAPGANEVVVAGADCGGVDPIGEGLIDADQAVVNGNGHHPLASITSNSWITGPEGQPGFETKIEHAYLIQAAAEGVGMYFAAGDNPGVNEPASDPYAIAVGGTTLGIGKTGSRVFETGWSTGLLADQKGNWVNQGDIGGGTGGGPSAMWKQPAYQRGIVPAALSRYPGRSGQYRSVPDISANADPATPMTVGNFNTEPGKKQAFYLTPGAGTSEATPLVAGLVADAQQGSKAPFGFLNPVFYKLAKTSAFHDSAFHDIVPFTASSPALYRAVSCPVALCGEQALFIFDVQSHSLSQGYDGQVTLKGYDNMTGLGTPNGQYFVKALRAIEK
jgi:subtilase family serine protease